MCKIMVIFFFYLFHFNQNPHSQTTLMNVFVTIQGLKNKGEIPVHLATR